ncbi:MAG: hypothetical protein LBR32_10895, partial [Propionibacteriaceae bacterium]|nr:hypothetical protein [Propionibacteriaceae bacterium]
MTMALGEVWVTQADVAPTVAPSFVDFVREQSVALQRFAYVVTGNHQDAQDAVQDALIGIFPKWDKVAAGGDVGAYVRRSIVNHHISAWRKGRRSTPVEDVAALAEPVGEDASAQVADKDWGMRLVQTLPPAQRA